MFFPLPYEGPPILTSSLPLKTRTEGEVVKNEAICCPLSPPFKPPTLPLKLQQEIAPKTHFSPLPFSPIHKLCRQTACVCACV